MVTKGQTIPPKKRKLLFQTPKYSIPKSIPNPKEDDDVQFTHVVKTTDKVTKLPFKHFSGNKKDLVLDGNELAYSLQGTDSWTSCVLMHLTHDYLSSIMLRNFTAPANDSDFVRVLEDGGTTPYFVPDFADLAMIPLPLKITFKHMIESSSKIPDEVKQVIESCGPSVPITRPCCRIDEGIERWTCYSNKSDVQVMILTKPTIRVIGLEVESSAISSTHLDGRMYSCTVKSSLNTRKVPCICFSYPRESVSLLFWNCQGIGRPSFLGNLIQLLEDHKPDVVILLEIRGPRNFLSDKLQALKVHKTSVLEDDQYYGGAAILSLRKQVTFLEGRANVDDKGVLYGFFQGVKSSYP